MQVAVHGRVVIAKFHYTGPTGPDQTKYADFVGDPGLRGSVRVRAGPVGQWNLAFSASDCGERVPRFESHRGRLCLSRQPL